MANRDPIDIGDRRSEGARAQLLDYIELIAEKEQELRGLQHELDVLVDRLRVRTSPQIMDGSELPEAA